MALTHGNTENKEIEEKKSLVARFFRKNGHAKQTSSGNVYFASVKSDAAFFDAREAAERSALTSQIIRALSKVESGDIAVGVSAESDAKEVFVADQLVERTANSKLIEEWQKSLNEYNDKTNSLIMVFDYDEWIQYRANHPTASLEKYLTVALTKVANDVNRGKMLSGQGEVSKTVGDYAEDGVLRDGAFSLSDNTSHNGKDVRYSIIVPGDLNKNLTIEGLMMEAPAAGRLIKERGISDKALKSLVFYHEEGHSIDGLKKEDSNTLPILFARGRMEKKADLNAVKKLYEEGNEEAAKFWMYWRNQRMASVIFSHAYEKAALSGEFPQIFDEESVKILNKGANKKQSKEKEKGEFGKIFDTLDKNNEILEAFSDMGMSVAYNTAPILYKFITKMDEDKEFCEQIKNMKAKEFDKWATKFLKENDVDIERFGKQIIDTAGAAFVADEFGRVQLGIPDNDDVADVFVLKDKLEDMIGVTPEEVIKAQGQKIDKINKRVNRYIHASKEGFFFGKEDGNAMTEQEYREVAKFFDTFYRKVERENVRNGGNETAAFDKVFVEEKNRLVEGNKPNKAVILSNLDRLKINYQDETKLKVNAVSKISAHLAETPAPDISGLSGDDLVAAHVANQIAKLDCAEKALRLVMGDSGSSFDPLDSAQFAKAEKMAEAFNSIIVREKMAQAYSAKITGDKEAKEVIGNSDIIRSKITKKAGGEFPGWMADFMVAATKGAPMYKMESLITRLDEKRKLLAIEVTENDAIFAKVKEMSPRLATRFEKIVASESSSLKVENDSDKISFTPDGKMEGLREDPIIPVEVTGYTIMPKKREKVKSWLKIKLASVGFQR